MKKLIIIVSGAYLLCVALLLCAGCVLGYIALHVKAATLPQGSSAIMLLVIYLPMAACMGATGICLIMKKNWARYSLYVMSIFALFVGLIMMVVFIFMPFPASSQATAATARAISAVFSGIFFIAIPALLLIFFTRKSVIGLFKSGMEVKILSPRPLGVTLISILFICGSLMAPLYLCMPFFSRMPMQLGGIILSGTPVKIWLLASAALCCYLGIGLWRLRKHAWISALAYQVLLMAVGAFNIAMLSDATVQQLIAATTRISSQTPPPHLSLNYFRLMYGASFIWPVGILIYLCLKRNVFVDKTEAPVA